MKWTYLLGAVVVASCLLLINGAPLVPILLGSAGAVLWSLRKRYS